MSPFLRLDLSFHAEAVFDTMLVRGHGYAPPPFMVLPLGTRPAPAREAPRLPHWSALDFEFGGALRQFHETVKSIARGVPPKRSMADAEGAVLEFEQEELCPGVWDLYAQSVELVSSST